MHKAAFWKTWQRCYSSGFCVAALECSFFFQVSLQVTWPACLWTERGNWSIQRELRSFTTVPSLASIQTYVVWVRASLVGTKTIRYICLLDLDYLDLLFFHCITGRVNLHLSGLQRRVKILLNRLSRRNLFEDFWYEKVWETPSQCTLYCTLKNGSMCEKGSVIIYSTLPSWTSQSTRNITTMLKSTVISVYLVSYVQ